MAKKVIGQVKLQIPAGKATPAPPVGPALGQHGVNIMDFCKAFNAKTSAKDQEGLIIPVVVTIYADRSYSFITKTPPASILLKRAANIAKGSGEPNKSKVGTVSQKQVEDIARLKMPDLNAASLEAAIQTVKGTARSMGIEVVLKMAKVGKKYEAAKKQIEARPYTVEDAMGVLKKVHFAKFNETIEVHMRLGVDPKHADQMVRGTVVLPHGLGKSKTVCVIASGDKIKEAEQAGAEFVGGDDMVEKIAGGWTDFDACIATPDMMRGVGRLGKVLGPRGLMPNPKIGTVTTDVAKAVKEVKAGKVEFRVDKTGIIHAPVGKIEFTQDQLTENARMLIDTVLKARPAALKGKYVKRITVASTMSPGVDLDLVALDAK